MVINMVIANMVYIANDTIVLTMMVSDSIGNSDNGSIW